MITPFLFQVISSCNDECIDFSSLVRDFPDFEEDISRFQANAVACKDYKSCIVGFFVAVFRWKVQTVDNPGADFLFETYHFQPIASFEKWWMSFHILAIDFGKPRWFPVHQIHQCLTQSFSPLDGSPAKVVGRCKRGPFPPEARGWTNRCILCLAPFRRF